MTVALILKKYQPDRSVFSYFCKPPSKGFHDKQAIPIITRPPVWGGGHITYAFPHISYYASIGAMVWGVMRVNSEN